VSDLNRRREKEGQIMGAKKTNLPQVTRRQFLFGSAVGALTLIGTTATKSGFVAAYADEEGNNSFGILIIGREDVAILAIDPSNNQVLPNMEVKIESYADAAKTKTLTATTNEAGICVVKVRDLSENPDEESPVDGYGFWAKVEATKEGYRDYATSLVRIQSGPGLKTESGGRQANLTIPSQKYDPATSFGYVRNLAFNDFDIQYFKSTFVATSGNDATHKLTIELVGNAGSNAKSSFVYDGNEIASASATFDRNGRATMEMSGEWLKTFEPYKKAQVFFSIDNADFEAPCNLEFYPGADGLTDSRSNDNAKLTIGENNNPFTSEEASLTSYRIKIPESMPYFGGSYYDLPLPELPIAFYMEPTGLVQLGVSINLLPLVPGLKGASWVGNKNWQYFRRESYNDSLIRRFSNECDAIQRYDNARANKTEGSKQGKQTKFGGDVNLTFDFNFVAQATWEWGSDKWTGGANALILIGLNYELGNQAVIGPVPIYYGFDVAFLSTLSLYIGWETKGGFREFGWVPDKEGMVWNPRFDFGFSLGLGIKGYMSFGGRGYLFVLGTVGLVSTDKPFPHYSVSGGIYLTIVVQALWFSATVAVYHWGNEKPFFDNWEDSNTLTDQNNTNCIPDGFKNKNATYFLANGEKFDLTNIELAPISDEKMLETAEFSAKAKEVSGTDGNPNLQLSVTKKDESNLTPKVSGFGIVSSMNSLTGTTLSPDLGVVPAVDDCIFEGVSSDSRHKILRASDGNTYLFRLCVVNVSSFDQGDGDLHFKFNEETGTFEKSEEALTSGEVSNFSTPRTRVVMQKLTSAGKWGDSRIIEFISNNVSEKFWRMNMNDYDFAVCESEDESGVFYFNIVSAEITSANKEDFKQLWKDQFVTLLKYNANKSSDEATVDDISLFNEFSGQACYCPGVFYNKAVGKPFFTFASATPTTGADTATYRLNVRACDPADLSTAATKTSREAFSSAQPLYVTFSSETGARWGESSGLCAIDWVMPIPGSENNAYQVCEQTYSMTSQTLQSGVIYKYQNVAEPVLIPNKGWILVDLDESGDEVKLHRELTLCTMDSSYLTQQYQVGIANITAFTAAADGSRLFAVRVMEGPCPTDDSGQLTSNPNAKLVSDGDGSEIKRYQIYAANWDPDAKSYHNFYPFCQTTHPLDMCQPTQVEDGLVRFVATEITNAEAGLGDIYQINVPLVCSLSLISATSTDVFAGIGDTCHAAVCVQNVGNLPISSFTVKLYDNEAGSGEPIATKRINNLKDSVFPAVTDYQGTDSDGKPIIMPVEAYHAKINGGKKEYGNIDSDRLESLLWPGDVRTYGDIEFTVPQSWSNLDSATVYAFVSEATADETLTENARLGACPNFSGDADANTASLSGSGDFKFEVTGDIRPDAKGVFADIDKSPENFEVNLNVPLAKDSYIMAADYAPLNDEAKKIASNLPKTGDDTGKLVGPLTVVGASALAMAAYSKRRSDNENLS
jgi:hypothetical protein